MEINFNVGSLKIVYNPLMEYFKKIQTNVSHNLVLIRDEKKVATNYEAIDLLVKAQGTLKMIGLLGIVKVLSLNTEALREVREVKHDTAKSINILETVNATMNDLVVYLEGLLNGQQDQPTKFYALYSQLAKLLNRNCSIKDLFMIRLDLREDVSLELKEELRVGLLTNEFNKSSLLTTMHKNHSNIKENINKMLAILDVGFEDLNSKQQYQFLCKSVYDSVQEIQNLKLSKTVYIMSGLQKLLICISSPIFNDDIVKLLKTEEKQSIKQNIQAIETVVADWIKEIEGFEETDKTSSLKADNDIVSNLMFLIIQSLKSNAKLHEMPVLKDLNTYFNFNFYEDLLKSTEITYTLIQKNPELVHKIEQHFLSLKEELTLLTDKDKLSDEFLIQHMGKYISSVQKIQESFNAVNIHNLNDLNNMLSAVGSQIKSKKIPFNELIQKEISLATLLIEYGIKTFTQTAADERLNQKIAVQTTLQAQRLLLASDGKVEDLSNMAMPIIDSQSKEKDARDALLSLYEQLGKELEKAEKVLDTYLRSEGENAEELKDIKKPLSSAKGIFTIVGKPNLSKLVIELQGTWEQVEKTGLKNIEGELLKKSIVILSGLTLLVNAEKNGNMIESDVIEARLLKSLNINPVAEFKDFSNQSLIEIKEIEKVEEKALEIEKVFTPQVEEISTDNDNELFEDTINDEDMLEVYLMESEEVLENIEKSTKALMVNLENEDEIVNLRRYFHTLKGSGRMVGLVHSGETAWVVEQVLSKVVSGTLALNKEMLNAVSETKDLFENSVESLKNTKATKIDMIRVQKLFAPFTENSMDVVEKTVSIEVVKPEVEEVSFIVEEVKPEIEEVSFEIKDVNDVNDLDSFEVEEVVEPEVEEVDSMLEEIGEISYENVNDFVPVIDKHIINGKEIGEELFNMFIEESNLHIKGMKDFLDSENSTQISNEFVICAHTLSSISKAVNLNDFARLVHKIEIVSTLAYEKDISLNKMQLRVIKNIVGKLDFYKETVNGKHIEAELFEEEIELLNDVKEDILSNKFETAPPLIVDNNKEESMDVKFKETVDFNFSVIQKSINNLQDEIKSLKDSGIGSVNTDELFSTLMSKVKVQMDEQYENLNSLIKKNVHDNHEIVNELFSKVDNIENSVQNLDAQQKNSDKENRILLQAIHKDILGLGESLKKKSNGSYLEPFSEELNSESPIGDMIHEEQEGSLNTEVLEILSNDNFLNPNNVVKVQSNASLFIIKNEFVKTIFEDTVSNVEDEIDDEILEISKEEADNMLEKIDSLMESVSPQFNLSQNNELKRYLHTLKGSVRMAGANKIGAVAHRLETILDYSENRKISLLDMQDLLIEEIDKIRFLMSDVRQELKKTQLDWLDRKDLENITITDTVESPTVIEDVLTTSLIQEPINNVVAIKKEEKQYIKINSQLIDSLINEAGEIRLTRTTLEGVADNERKSLNELKSSSNKLLRMLKEVENQAESQIQAGKDKFTGESDVFDPLEFDRYTRLQELTRFMNEIIVDIQDTVVELDGYNKIQHTTISNQTVLTNNVLDSLMKVRLVPFNTMSNRLYKVTRETAKELGKKVILELYGENTEFDRVVLDKIISPIDHILRNSISHGIEIPEKRISSNKESAGVIKITTELEGNFIIVSIQDDGAGIDTDKIKKLGIQRGLLSSNKQYSKEEIIDLIFHNGFSTAEKVSKVAGRGVGMDIVRSEISSLNGTITIKTETGKGTKFIIVLPVALATNNAMLSENMGKLVAIPAILVNEVISLKKPVLETAYNNGFIVSRDKQYKIVYMGHLVGELPFNQRPEIRNYNSIVLVNYLNEDLAVHVDKLNTTNEILIKQIGTHLSKVKGLLGVTLIGDGRQGIVVNPIVLENHYESNLKHKHTYDSNKIVEDQSLNTISVMVVDDSITVRRVTSKILERNSFNVILAKDGEDALEQLQVLVPDIILSDIEMPNMDGFELLKNLKNSDKYKNIPIIMITSRTADKHKNYAYELGADGFLGKPYQEEELLQAMSKLLKNKVK